MHTIDDTKTLDEAGQDAAAPGEAPEVMGLVLLWSAVEQARVGEVCLLPVDPRQPAYVLGRKGARLDVSERPGDFAQQRPGTTVNHGPLRDPAMSRRQLVVKPAGATLSILNIGRLPLFLNGQQVHEGLVRAGDVLRLGRRAVLMCVTRPPELPVAKGLDVHRAQPFGAPDRHGIVGESPAVWTLRGALAFAAPLPMHVLIVGESGTGKELAARAIHRASDRGDKAFISRNAATIPDGLVDAEFFGHARDYPNAGSPARVGLLGEAHGATLFLDEIGELPTQLQAHLLRVMDDGGEYQRLGETRRRQSDVRVVAATNRALDELRYDLVPRFTLRVSVPGLNRRREDVPLLLAHLLETAIAENEAVRRHVPPMPGPALARFEPELVAALSRHAYGLHVRELRGLLWTAISSSPEGQITLTDAVRAELGLSVEGRQLPSAVKVTKAMIEAALERHDGVQEMVWRELGLKNRYVLRRLIKKFGVKSG